MTDIIAIFQYIRLIRNAGPLPWVWKESADLAAMCVTSNFQQLLTVTRAAAVGAEGFRLPVPHVRINN